MSRHERVYRFIEGFIEINGHGPTYAEMERALHLQRGALTRYLAELREEDYITWTGTLKTLRVRREWQGMGPVKPLPGKPRHLCTARGCTNRREVEDQFCYECGQRFVKRYRQWAQDGVKRAAG